MRVWEIVNTGVWWASARTARSCPGSFVHRIASKNEPSVMNASVVFC